MVFKDEDISNACDGISIIQKKDGFRFGTDSVLLADFFSCKKESKILEIGTGSGIIPILLCSKKKIEKIKTVEIQKDIFELAVRNIKINKLEKNILIENIDIKKLNEGNTYDCVISNPPYMTLDGKEINLNSSKSISRHEIALDLKELVISVKKMLKPRGEFFLVHKSYRFLEICEELQKNKFSIKRVKFVYFSKNNNSNIVLIEASKGRKNIFTIEPPIFLDEK